MQIAHKKMYKKLNPTIKKQKKQSVTVRVFCGTASFEGSSPNQPRRVCGVRSLMTEALYLDVIRQLDGAVLRLIRQMNAVQLLQQSSSHTSHH